MKRSCIIVAALTVGQAVAAELPKEGKYDVLSCWSGTGANVQLSKDAAFNYELTGSTITNPPGGAFDKTSFRCVGMLTNIGGKFTQTQVCEHVDQSGDKFLAQSTTEDPGQEGVSPRIIRQTVVAGTGKYEGMTRTGINETYEVPAMKPGTFQRCGHATGTYKLK
jgi:hypothetical protein